MGREREVGSGETVGRKLGLKRLIYTPFSGILGHFVCLRAECALRHVGPGWI